MVVPSPPENMREGPPPAWHGHLARASQGRPGPAVRGFPHGRDARETHGRDAHATSHASPDVVTAYVAAGSNIQPRRNIAEALRLLRGAVQVAGVSTFYRTPAIGPDGRVRAGDEEFLNGVFAVRTDLPARRLKFEVLRPIEDRLGRVRSADKYAPRTIDLDVVLYGSEVMDEPGLKLPADDIRRPWVALPLRQLAGDVPLPGSGECLACLWSGPPPEGMVADLEFTRLLREICTT